MTVRAGDAGTIADRWRRCPAIRFEQSDQPRPLRNRIHVDAGYPGPIGDSVVALKADGGRDAELLLPTDHLRSRVQAAVAAGGRILEHSADRCLIADPEGNEIVLRCRALPAGR